jgi:hypothetical protein
VCAAAARSGASEINENTRLSPTATLRFGINSIAADEACQKAPPGAPRVAVVTATFKGYDALKGTHAPDCSGALDYFVFTDVPGHSHNKIVDTFPYHLHDENVTLPMSKNSLNNLNLPPEHAAGVVSKYYKVYNASLAWRCAFELTISRICIELTYNMMLLNFTSIVADAGLAHTSTERVQVHCLSRLERYSPQQTLV